MAIRVLFLAALGMFTRKCPSTLWQKVWFMCAVPSYKNPFYIFFRKGFKVAIKDLDGNSCTACCI